MMMMMMTRLGCHSIQRVTRNLTECLRLVDRAPLGDCVPKMLQNWLIIPVQ